MWCSIVSDPSAPSTSKEDDSLVGSKRVLFGGKPTEEGEAEAEGEEGVSVGKCGGKPVMIVSKGDLGLELIFREPYSRKQVP